jgi:hypothetical protein
MTRKKAKEHSTLPMAASMKATGRMGTWRDSVFSPRKMVEDTKASTSRTIERVKGHSTLLMASST